MTSDDVSTAKARYGSNAYDIFRTVTTYALGGMTSQMAVNTKLTGGSGGWSSGPGTSTTTAYAWYDAAVQDYITYDSNTGSGSNPLYTTDLQLNAIGQLTGAAVNDGLPKTVAYRLDEAGQDSCPPDSKRRLAQPDSRVTHAYGSGATYALGSVLTTVSDCSVRRPMPSSLRQLPG